MILLFLMLLSTLMIYYLTNNMNNKYWFHKVDKKKINAYPTVTSIKYFENTNECPTGYVQVECTTGNTNFPNCNKPNVIACSNGNSENYYSCPENYIEKNYLTCAARGCPASAFSCVKQIRES
jgi:hypothetical protein